MVDRRTVKAIRVLILVAAGLMGLAIVAVRAEDGTLDLGTMLQVLVGWSFAACGVLLWARRPANRLGVLMTTVGILWLVGRTLLLIPHPVAATAGMWLSDLWAAAFALFLLSFPTGRLTSRLDRAIVGVFFFVSVPLEFLWLLFYVPPSGLNALAIAADESAARAIDFVQRATLSIGAILLVISVGRRWLRSSGLVRRTMAPVLVASIAVLLSSIEWILFGLGLTLEPLEIAILLAQIAIPIAIVTVLLRAWMARVAVADLVVDLGQTPTPARLREALANALDDPELRVAYWSPTDDRFVDSAGAPATLPAPGSAQAVTILERDGVPVAAIIHDAALLDEPGLMASVASAMRLAVENDRLTGEIEAQLQEVRASRARIVEAGDRERRRVERDLHDGAQQRLVSLSLELQVARRALGDSGDPAVRRSLERAAGEAMAALAELRDLALGIHPLILTESGLGAAVESLADRTSVEVAVDVGPERYPPAVEGAAYFVISEALTNVTKYARATKAAVRVRDLDGHLSIEVDDDGVGGAD
ncbi:MAG TPA: histidine kinase, partial [Candidatus Limnocylindrales bacterium]|nr:histidine kinase [Candidatus Limnocylindrales bacterium]